MTTRHNTGIQLQLIASALLLYMAASSLFVAQVHAQANDTQKSVKNPFAEEDSETPVVKEKDLMLGVFSSDQMTVRVEKSQGSIYEGEFESGGRFYAFKGERKGDELKGTFTVNSDSFPFSLTIDGDEVTFRTAKRAIRLPRRGTKLKPLTDTPSTSRITPPPSEVKPKKVGEFKDYGRVQNRDWLKFGEGVFADYEITHAGIGQVNQVSRQRFSLSEVKDNVVILNVQNFVDADWFDLKRVPWLAGSKTLGAYGFTGGKSRNEKLVVKNKTLDCEVTVMAAKSKGDSPTTVNLEVWRSKGVNLPLQAVALGPFAVVLDGDVVRIRCQTNSGGLTTDTDFKVTELEKNAVVGNWLVPCSEFKGATIVRRGDGDYHAQYVKLLSQIVPGGVVKHMETVRQGNRSHYRNQTMVAYGFLEDD